MVCLDLVQQVEHVSVHLVMLVGLLIARLSDLTGNEQWIEVKTTSVIKDFMFL